MTLPWRNEGYTEVVWRQTTETVIRVLENAFRHFGGVAHSLVDNLILGRARTCHNCELRPVALAPNRYGFPIPFPVNLACLCLSPNATRVLAFLPPVVYGTR